MCCSGGRPSAAGSTGCSSGHAAARAACSCFEGIPASARLPCSNTPRERARGLTVIGTRGVESEGELPFAALSELLGPLLDRLAALPGPQAAALESALALGPPAPGDAFAVAAGTLNLIVDAAQDSPLLVVVDDAQWLDAGSAATLHLVARRLDEHAVAMLVAVRDRAPSAFDGGGFPELRLTGLEPGRGRRPAGRSGADGDAGGGAPPDRGNRRQSPCAPRAPSPAGRRAAHRPCPAPRSAPRGAEPSAAFELRLSAMPPETRRALVVAAASGSEALAHTLDALRCSSWTPSRLSPRSAAELVSLVEGRLLWRHPLLRSTTYHCASSFERRAAHTALASVSSGFERAWHLAATAVGPDEPIARELEDAGMNARLETWSPRRGDRLRACGGVVRGRRRCGAPVAPGVARLPSRRPRRSGTGARANGTAQGRGAHSAGGAPAPDRRHRDVEWRRRDRARAAARGRRGDRDPRPGAGGGHPADAALACQMSGNVERTLAIARRAHELAPSPLHTEPLLLNAMILAGEARAARPAVSRLVANRLAAGSTPADSVLFAANVGQAAIWLGEYAEARRLFVRELVAARTSGSLAPLPFLLACLSDLELRLGRWQAAYTNAAESVRVAEETGQLNVLSFGLATLARVEAATAREEECRLHAARALKARRRARRRLDSNVRARCARSARAGTGSGRRSLLRRWNRSRSSSSARACASREWWSGPAT